MMLIHFSVLSIDRRYMIIIASLVQLGALVTKSSYNNNTFVIITNVLLL